MTIEGAVCVVTGATEGIGRAIAVALARRGGRLAVCARTGAKVERLVAELRGAGGQAAGAACDVSNESDVRVFTDFVRREVGPTDVLVNNAGLGYRRDVAEMSSAEFDETMAVNVRGVFLMTRAVLPDMMRRGAGHIVNIASLAGKNPVPGAAAYAASKHAVLGFSQSLMLEVREHGIRVIAVCPGSVVTPFFDKSGMGLQHPDRKLLPDDVADVVVAALALPLRANASAIDIRPTNP